MRKKALLRDLVIQRTQILIKVAFEWVNKDRLDFARNAIRIIEEMRKETNVRIPPEIKRLYCKKCLTPLVPGKTSRVRIKNRGKKIERITTCLICGEVYRLEIAFRSRER
ncbi:MAG: ribonuclease P protein component 4 [Sulfolobales archaeon]